MADLLKRMNGKKLMMVLGYMVLLVGVIVALESIVIVREMKKQVSPELGIVISLQRKRSPQPTTSEKRTPPLVPPVPAFPEKALLDVPFTPQAPFAEWGDLMFENACEETAAIMAMHWVNGTPLSREDAKHEIIAISVFERDAYGGPYDLSADDVGKLIRNYFHYEYVTVRHGIAIDDIRTELARGNVVIVPVNGRKLLNPFYTPPGALEHMIVMRGYDDAEKIFITNDPGTRRGEAMRYPYQVIADAMRDYPTGDHAPITTTTTAMIVVAKAPAAH